MTKPATVSATKPTDLRAAFGFHAVPFTREITTDNHLRLPFLATRSPPSRPACPQR
jgi:hypothetical protein